MDRQIELTTSYNTLFDAIVTTTEESFSLESTKVADNQYNVTTESVSVSVVCNDNQYNTVTVFINNVTIPDNPQIGSLTININGDMDESLHNVPRAIRKTINDYIDAIYDVLDSWIDGTFGEE